MTSITLPLNERQVQAIAAAAYAFGIESWELAVHLLAWKPGLAVSHRGGDDQ